MERSFSRHQIVADFFAQGYRVSGAYALGSRSLSDVIYDSSTNYLAVKQAYLSPITDPAKISAHYESTLLIKDNLDFILLLDQKDGLRRDQKYTLGSRSFDLCLTVPFFQIQGRLQTNVRNFDPRAFLSREAGVFITLFDVTARCTFSPDITYRGGSALIARQSISFLGETTPEDA